MALIVADTREGKGANPFLDEIIEANNNKNCKLSPAIGGGNIRFEKKLITIGDYVIYLPQPGNTELQTAVIIERKTWKDLAGSIKDTRIKGQTESLQSIKDKKAGCRVYFIIEGKREPGNDTKVARMCASALKAKMRHNLLRGMPYIRTGTPRETAEMIVELARDAMKLQARGECFIINRDYMDELRALNEKYRIDNGIRQRLEAIAAEIINPAPINGGEEQQVPPEFTERRVVTDEDVVIKIWGATSCGPVTATIMARKYNLSSIITADDTEANELCSEIAELTYEGGRLIGKARANKIMRLRTDDKELFTNMLEKIPGVSKLTAAAFSEQWNAKDICLGRVSIEDMANLRIGKNNRRIGAKLAERIDYYLNYRRE